MHLMQYRSVKADTPTVVFLLLKYVTKFRLPPHPCESVRIWRANIFFDKTGSEMTSGI
jgi:hypothetical protein